MKQPTARQLAQRQRRTREWLIEQGLAVDESWYSPSSIRRQMQRVQKKLDSQK